MTSLAYQRPQLPRIAEAAIDAYREGDIPKATSCLLAAAEALDGEGKFEAAREVRALCRRICPVSR